VKRREFIAGVGSAAAWSAEARAQQTPVPVVGFLGNGPQYAPLLAAFLRGLNEIGYVEGHSVTIEYRFAEGQVDRLPVLAADLVRRNVAVIVAQNTQTALAGKAATQTIPIVFQTGSDPVEIAPRPSVTCNAMSSSSGALNRIPAMLARGRIASSPRDVAPSRGCPGSSP
jgi:putative tryptophan/tyrosine transport system substrate-binding protein